MRRLLMRGLAVLVVVLAALAAWKWDEITRLRAVLTLFDEDRIVANFSRMDAAFLSRPVPVAGPALPLPEGPAMTLPEGAGDWIAERAVTGLVVLKDGVIVHESYHLGTSAEDLRISWSVAKSVLSALYGILLAEGAVGTLDDPVTRHAPALAGSAYDGATVRDVLTMQSGVTFNEDYLDFNSDINRMGRVLALGGSMDGFAADLKARDRAPGTGWQYVSIDTHVIGMVIRGATGRTIPDLVSEKLFGPLGLEAEPRYLTDGEGVAFVLGGLNLRTRDYARIGQLFLDLGRADGRQIVPEDWVLASTRPQAATAPGAMGYGYQWWIPPGSTEGEFQAQGVYGQYIYVNRPAGVVIAVNAADRGFTAEGVDARNTAMFRAIAAAAR
ncbi:class C beta-lactamase-related serine hydrolase [Aliigemmobacter aestuarii]|uniref:Class C beta-lactamase-related serine hydrolase n=2 Tax=Aliigemmobacter aestuarii TaxID=1445661 RepID=A0A4S3MTJ5_9RHOB|nr:serine hydrolase [Gemmobacter aestuarii]THD84821.1 class C beta-lactamase-related serine hydrolase [Gemmobacter aestuarii]